MIAKVPPGIQTINVLIHGFTQVGEHTLARTVVEYLLRGTQLRPTTLTWICLLNHYAASQDLIGFHRVPTRHTGSHLADAFVHILDRVNVTAKVRFLIIKNSNLIFKQ